MIKRKKTASLLLALLTAVSMTACNEVPEDVKSRAEAQKGADESVETDEQGRVKIKNLTFDCAPEPYDPDNIYIFKEDEGRGYDESSDYSELKNKLIRAGKELMGFDISPDEIEIATEKDYPVYDEEGKEIPGKKREIKDPDAYYWSEEKKQGITMYETSDLFHMSRWDNYTGKYPYSYFYRDIYYPWSYPEDKLVMNDHSEMTIKEAVEEGEELIAKAKDIGMLDDKVDIALSKISVQHSDGDGVIIVLYYTKTYKGVRFLEEGITINNFGDDRMLFTQLRIDLVGKGNVFRMNNTPSYRIEEPTEKVEIITYDEARHIVAEGLAPNMVFTVKEAHLCYAESLKGDFVVKKSGYRPMWEFVLYDPSRKRKIYSMNDILNGNKDVISDMDFPKTIALVDAVNGDLYYINPFDQVMSVTENK